MKRRPPELLYEDAARRPLLVYRVCSYLQARNPHGDGECRQCPRELILRGEVCYHGSYMMAEELIAVVA